MIGCLVDLFASPILINYVVLRTSLNVFIQLNEIDH